MATRTGFGRDLLAQQWAHAEFAAGGLPPETGQADALRREPGLGTSQS
ncbi:hypothetical protein [Pseudonocardia sp. H11422]|nr:hypothetical protein [Pseudonocardia sp. H11422]